MTQINSYLTFSGNCHETVVFYKVFVGCENTFQTVGESPMSDKMSKQMKGCILYATLNKSALVLMGFDMVSEKRSPERKFRFAFTQLQQ